MRSEIRYATAGGCSVAFETFGRDAAGDAPDIVLVAGYATHLDLDWEMPAWVRFAERLGSFARVIHFDKRGTGLSDRLETMPTLEERMDDVRAVMDATGSNRATLIGVSEGAPMSILFAATHPERVASLVLCGGMARSTWAPDYPWATPAEDLVASAAQFLSQSLASGDDLEIWMPSWADDPGAREQIARYRRAAVSPKGLEMMFGMFLDIDVRDVLPAVSAPTLVIHRRGDRVVNRRAGEFLASRIAGATYVEMPGNDHFPWAADSDEIVAHIREFVTGSRGPAPEADRVLATVLFTDIVDSTGQAAALGDSAWRSLLETHHALVHDRIARFRGRQIKTLGDGVLATFDGPGRAVQCAEAIATESEPLGLRIRAGIHCGEVEVMGEDIGGIAVHTAARILGLAGAGEVLVSSTIRGLVAGSGIEFEDRGTHELKGIPEPWQVFRATCGRR
ncbi:MAG TPA: adenylate/guanylate cyclase domain-containing protein [Actinomycetota bacterium]